MFLTIFHLIGFSDAAARAIFLILAIGFTPALIDESASKRFYLDIAGFELLR